MLANYSEDLRWRLVLLILVRKMSYTEIADVLYISQKYIPLYACVNLLVCHMADSGILFPLILGVTMQQPRLESKLEHSI